MINERERMNELRGKLYSVYFGHPVNFYNTPDESRLVERIQAYFPNGQIENPNQPKHDEGYKKWKLEKGSGMKYFFEEVLPQMEVGVFLPFEDGFFGAGVYGEAEHLNKVLGRKIFEISLEGKVRSMSLDPARCLSVEETRKRIYGEKKK